MQGAESKHMACTRSRGRAHRSASAFLLDVLRELHDQMKGQDWFTEKRRVRNASILDSNASHAHKVSVDLCDFLQADTEIIVLLPGL